MEQPVRGHCHLYDTGEPWSVAARFSTPALRTALTTLVLAFLVATGVQLIAVGSVAAAPPACPVTGTVVKEETPGQVAVTLTNTGATEITADIFLLRPYESGPVFVFLEPGAWATSVYAGLGDERYDIRVNVSGCEKELRFKGRWSPPEPPSLPPSRLVR
ncbi:hypothetical protein K1W54_05540 [Micromonospora sp. CPCC 205371]|nr:hypothetical protein [Micromonospora sp. CPCC 205371]